MEKNKVINAIIVDDEYGCIKNLEYYLVNFCPNIRLLATANTLSEALDIAGDAKIDVAFLDIELFNDNIFNLLAENELPDFKVVFVTAYEKYAIKAFRYNAIDYILKPLVTEDVIECYRRILTQFSIQHADVQHNSNAESTEPAKSRKIIIKEADRIYIIKNEDIYYLSGNGFYSEITFVFNGEERSITLSKPLNKIESEYSKEDFFRVHKSYLINVNRISDIIREDNITLKMSNNKEIPVAKRRVSEFLAFINKTV